MGSLSRLGALPILSQSFPGSRSANGRMLLRSAAATVHDRLPQSSEQFRQRPSFFHQLKRPSLAVNGAEIVNAQRMKDGPGDVFRCDGVVGRVFGALVACAENLAAADAAT